VAAPVLKTARKALRLSETEEKTFDSEGPRNFAAFSTMDIAKARPAIKTKPFRDCAEKYVLAAMVVANNDAVIMIALG
jgi:hypothetical protein